MVVLSHLGEENSMTGIDSHALVEATNGIDAVLDGHTHAVIPCEWVANKDGKKIPIGRVSGTDTQWCYPRVISHHSRSNNHRCRLIRKYHNSHPHKFVRVGKFC